MHLAHLRLRDFRNYPRLDADFLPGFHLLLGDNAQGKTNILEAIYLLATLRSFRGVGGAQMIRHGHKGYFVGAKVVAQGEHEIKMYWSSQERSLSLDGRPVRKVTDYLDQNPQTKADLTGIRQPLVDLKTRCGSAPAPSIP